MALHDSPVDFQSRTLRFKSYNSVLEVRTRIIKTFDDDGLSILKEALGIVMLQRPIFIGITDPICLVPSVQCRVWTV